MEYRRQREKKITTFFVFFKKKNWFFQNSKYEAGLSYLLYIDYRKESRGTRYKSIIRLEKAGDVSTKRNVELVSLSLGFQESDEFDVIIVNLG